MQLNQELFLIPQKERFILYSPLTNSSILINKNLVMTLQKIKNDVALTAKEEEAINVLKQRGIITEKSQEQPSNHYRTEEEYCPTRVTLMPTHNCNLRCVYCYSNGGESVRKRMDFQIAKTAIDFVVENALKDEKEKVSLGFHGGGEPLLSENMSLIKRAVDYFMKECEKRRLKPNISAATNGLVNRLNLEWIVESFNNLNISFDGPEDIQNLQRPKPENKPSYGEVVRTIEYLESKRFDYGIRATITSDSVSRILEIIEHFKEIAPSASAYHLEPLFECGRCETTGAKSPDNEAFIKEFLLAQQKFKELNGRIFYSGSGLEVTKIFCGASGRNFFITPGGNVTTCLEVSRESDPRSEIFFIGMYNQEIGKFEFNPERISKLKSRTIENLPHCKDCFAKYNCAGDCFAKAYSNTGNILGMDNYKRCVLNRTLLVENINRLFENTNS